MRTLVVSALLAFSAATALAAEPKKVIVCTVTTGFRHSSIPFAEKSLQKLGDESKAFTIVDFARQPEVEVPKKPNKPGDLKPDADDKAKAKYEKDIAKYNEELAKWTPEVDAKAKAAQTEWNDQLKASLGKLSPENLKAKKIDAVIFANTTGDLPLPDKEGFIQWIADGGVFMGMHSASDTFHGFPGYNAMLQGEFKTHGPQVSAALIAADTKHPANGAIGETWNLAQEEMYEMKDGSHDRAKLRALWYLRTHPVDKSKAGYHPVSWCRLHGKGRVFYTSLGHREDLWDETDAVKDRKNSPEISKQFQAHVLGGIKWALGLAEGSSEPNPTAQ